MAFCRVVFPLLVLSVVSCYASNVPVYLWGELTKSSVRSNPLTTYSTDEFEAILKQELADDPLTLVFIEETLSVEDFSLKNDDGETSFPYLHDNLQEAIYLPIVKNPLLALSRSAEPLISDHLVLNENGLSEIIAPGSSSSGRVMFINLKDARPSESRADMLRRHDAFIQQTIAEMPETLKIVAIYTANYPSWTIPVTKQRVRRAVESNSRSYALDGILLNVKSIHLVSGNDTRTLPGLTSQKSEFNGTVMNTTMVFDNTTLVLNFIQKSGYWFFDTVHLTVGDLAEELYPNEDLFALMGFCYRCSQHVGFSSINASRPYSVQFDNLKIQPFFEPSTVNTTLEFGDSFNCVGYFSAPIWAGLFVTFILLLITFYGIMMMLDIRTMDRFDDPKGKTITINAE